MIIRKFIVKFIIDYVIILKIRLVYFIKNLDMCIYYYI